MRHDVPADRLQGVCPGEHRVAIRVRHDLVRHNDRDAKLIRQPGEVSEELPQVHLPRAQLPPTFVFSPVQVRHRVHDYDAKPRLRHHPRGG